MFAKLILTVVAVTILKPALSAEIQSKLEIGDSETSVLETNAEINSSDDESTTITIWIPNVAANGETSDETIGDVLPESNEEPPLIGTLSNENSDAFVLLPMSLMEALRLSIAQLRDAEARGVDNVQLSVFTSSGNGFQLVDSVDRRRRRGNNREDSRLVDPRASPHVQLVDDTLRRLAIKSPVDDLAAKLFPTLHLARRSLQDRK